MFVTEETQMPVRRDGKGRMCGWSRARTASCAVLVLVASSARSEVTVSLKPKARAAGRLVRLADVAHVAGDQPEMVRRVMAVMVGAVPDPGEIKTIARDHIRARVYQEGLSSSDVLIAGERWVAVSARTRGRVGGASGFGITVARSDEILRAVRVRVAEELGCPAREVDVDLLSLHWTRRPDGGRRCQYAVSKRTSGGSLGRAHYIVDALDGADAVGRAVIWTDTVRYRDAFAPRRDLAPKDVIGAGDLFVVRVPVRGEGRRYVSDASRAVGRETSRRVAAHEPLPADALRRRPLVEEGSMVTVVLETPRCKIADEARAQESGTRGQVIRVRNVRSQRTFLARVADEHTVMVMRSSVGEKR